MAYTKQNFQSGDVLYASQLNAMDDEIERLSDVFVTPEMYGAVGDGIHDDGPALLEALNTEKRVELTQDLYCFSMVVVDGKNVYLSGNGFTVHFDFNNALKNENDVDVYDTIFFKNDRVEDPEAPLKRIWDTREVKLSELIGVVDSREGEPGYSTRYHMGYVSYKGNVPFIGKYAELMEEEYLEEYCFYEYHLHIENVKFHFTRCRGRGGLKVARYCNSVIRNVECISLDEEGTVGLLCQECYNLLLDKCFAQGWYADHTWATRGNQGYGIQIPGGDKITILNCGAWNNKCGAMIAGNRTIWTTNVLVNGFKSGADIVKENDIRTDGINTTYRWANGISVHADCLNLIFNNIQVDFPKNYSTRVVGFKVSCPEAVVNNVTVNSPKGYISFGTELNETLYVSNVIAPNNEVILGNSRPGSGNGDSCFLRTLYIDNSHFKSVFNGATSCILYMNNCQIESRIFDVNHLVLTNCTIYGRWETDWPGMTPLTVVDDAILTGCTIYMNRSWLVGKNVPVIKAKDNQAYMVNCHVMKPSWGVVFKKNQEQENVHNLLVDNLHGLIFGNPEFSVLGDCELC